MSKNLGRNGEKIARKYAKKARMKILETNCRAVRGEIDLIARDKEQIVFIEVKIRTNLQFGYLEKFVSPTQQNLYKIAATYYIEKIGWKGQIRFDIIALHVNNNQTWNLTHLQDAFY